VNIALFSGIFSISGPAVYNITLLDTLKYNKILWEYMGENAMVRRTIFEGEIESLEVELTGRYPIDFLSEVEVNWPCAVSVATMPEAI